MKNLSSIWVLLALVLFSSCGDIVEEIHLKEDGSGTYDMHSDMMKGMLEMASMMTAAMSDDMTPEQIDSMDVAMREEIWKDFPAEVDSIIDIRKEMPDSLRNDPRIQKLLEHTEMYMRGSKESGVMNIGMEHEFKNLQGLTSFFADMERIENGKPSQGGKSNPFSGSTCVYDMNKKSFSRVVTGKTEWTKEEKQSAKMMFSDATYRTVLHLPRDVKKVKGAGLIEQTDRKVVFEYAFLDIVDGKEDGAFLITFK